MKRVKGESTFSLFVRLLLDSPQLMILDISHCPSLGDVVLGPLDIVQCEIKFDQTPKVKDYFSKIYASKKKLEAQLSDEAVALKKGTLLFALLRPTFDLSPSSFTSFILQFLHILSIFTSFTSFIPLHIFHLLPPSPSSPLFTPSHSPPSPFLSMR